LAELIDGYPSKSIRKDITLAGFQRCHGGLIR
jgi:hypothetical protein